MATYYVNSGAGGTNSGADWTNAYTALASAITAATAGIFGVPAGFVVNAVVSLMTKPPGPESQQFIERLRYPRILYNRDAAGSAGAGDRHAR